MAVQDHAHLNHRQTQIVAALRRLGYVSIEQLAKEHQVTQQTIRRDINRLCDLGLMERFHGGAVQSSKAQNIGHEARRKMLPENKAAVAAALVAEVPDNCSLFLDVGTTMTAVAHALRNRSNLRIVTNNLEAAQVLADRDDFETIVTGGVVRAQDGAAVGEEAVHAIKRYLCDFAIIGTSGIDRSGYILDFDIKKVRASEAMIENARKVYLGTDHTKFDRRAMIKSAPLSDIDLIVTDEDLPDWLATLAQRADCRSLVAQVPRSSKAEAA